MVKPLEELIAQHWFKFFKFNNLYCPRDTKDQIKYFKKAKKIKKNSIVFWKGHVAVCISKTRLIHAYGPKKSIMYGHKNGQLNSENSKIKSHWN